MGRGVLFQGSPFLSPSLSVTLGSFAQGASGQVRGPHHSCSARPGCSRDLGFAAAFSALSAKQSREVGEQQSVNDADGPEHHISHDILRIEASLTKRE